MSWPAPDRRKILALTVAGALGLCLLAAVASWGWRRGAPPAPAQAPLAPQVAAAPAPASPPPAPAELQVEQVLGAVDTGGALGPWRPVAPGDHLRADDQLRTGPGASAELSAGPASRLVVGERTQLGVRELGAAVHRFRLTRGLVKVDYQPDGDRLVRIEAASGAAVAEARAARFHVAANGLAFAVASQTGAVTLSSSGSSVTLAQGEQALAEPGRPPSAPRPIPTDILLKVAAASRLGTAGGCLDTTGQAEPGALVTVDGEPVEVGQAGRFPVRVARRSAAGATVQVTSPDGRVATRTVACTALPDAQIRELKVRWKRGQP